MDTRKLRRAAKDLYLDGHQSAVLNDVLNAAADEIDRLRREAAGNPAMLSPNTKITAPEITD